MELKKIKNLAEVLETADAVIVGAGAGLSTSAGFDKQRLFYTQGTYGLWQCGKPCHQKTYDNEETVRKMVKEQRRMLVPSELVPHCPVCGRPMTMNLRSDDIFVEDEGWHQAAGRYEEFLRRHEGMKLLFLELGVGGNTPVFCSLRTRQKVRKNAVKQQIADGSHINSIRKYEERRCA